MRCGQVILPSFPCLVSFSQLWRFDAVVVVVGRSRKWLFHDCRANLRLTAVALAVPLVCVQGISDKMTLWAKEFKLFPWKCSQYLFPSWCNNVIQFCPLCDIHFSPLCLYVLPDCKSISLLPVTPTTYEEGRRSWWHGLALRLSHKAIIFACTI